ncbi:MAG: hypothetical protein H0V09_00365 [Gemmatimonadetes bacterium]|nr:hypothetical protein [Gemmatimonadota bacterium]
MAELPSYSNSNGDNGDDAGEGPDRGLTTGTPRWVYVFGILAIVLVLLFVIIHFLGGGLGDHTSP